MQRMKGQTGNQGEYVISYLFDNFVHAVTLLAALDVHRISNKGVISVEE